jgi:hypothetical protein
MSTSNAQWLYDQTMVGDIVEVSGTSNVQDLGNGITVWNETWLKWLARSATGSVSTVATGTPVASDQSGDGGNVVVPSERPTPSQSAQGSVVPGVPGLVVPSVSASPSASPSLPAL